MNSLYLHIPFCRKKCFYCSFVVSVGHEDRIDSYLDCLEKESDQYKGAAIKTIYIGGGTPTMISHKQLGRLFESIHSQFHLATEVEWTIEANPEGLEDDKLALIRQAGVNRISLGIQSLDNKYLRILGRNHDSRSARQAFDRIRKNGFDNINVDMMFSFPGQTIEELKKDINEFVKLQSDHISLYSLTVEKNSRFYAQNICLDNDQYQAYHYQTVCDMLCTAGFHQYEISNFAKPSKIAQHNMNYWQGGHYFGLGIGAHSHIGTRRYWNTSRLQDYIAGIQKGNSVQEGCEELTAQDKMNECVLFGLRMNQGVELKVVEQKFGCFLRKDQQKKIHDLVRGGFLDFEGGILKTTAKGRIVLDELCAQLI